ATLGRGDVADGAGGAASRRSVVRRNRLAPRELAAFGDALQRFRAHRPRRREQEALPEADVVIQEIDDGALALDLLGEEVDAEAAEQVGEVGGMDVAGDAAEPVEQEIGLDLDEAEAAGRKLARLEAQVGHVVERETEAALGQRRKALVLNRSG